MKESPPQVKKTVVVEDYQLHYFRVKQIFFLVGYV